MSKNSDVIDVLSGFFKRNEIKCVKNMVNTSINTLNHMLERDSYYHSEIGKMIENNILKGDDKNEALKSLDYVISEQKEEIKQKLEFWMKIIEARELEEKIQKTIIYPNASKEEIIKKMGHYNSLIASVYKLSSHYSNLEYLILSQYTNLNSDIILSSLSSNL